MKHDAVVIGAGVSGLQCARRLVEAGADVVVLDRSFKAGGRCATRHFEGQPVDFGSLFLHGRNEAFLAAVAAVSDATPLEGWPRRIHGRGTPCQPAAFDAAERRVAFEEGINAFPQALASGLEVRLRCRVVSLRLVDGAVEVATEDGGRHEGRDVVLAMALEESVALLHGLGDWDAARGGIALLETLFSVPSLTLISGYPRSSPTLEWDLSYPEDSRELQLISHESSKRPGARELVMVYQGSVPWSHSRFDDPVDLWSRALLDEAARLLGPWAAAPGWTHAHRWLYSRVDGANALAAPLVLPLGECRISVTGDVFAPGGGVQAAWLSGDRLGRRLAAG